VAARKRIGNFSLPNFNGKVLLTSKVVFQAVMPDYCFVAGIAAPHAL
jgi:hypothetical protein